MQGEAERAALPAAFTPKIELIRGRFKRLGVPQPFRHRPSGSAFLRPGDVALRTPWGQRGDHNRAISVTTMAEVCTCTASALVTALSVRPHAAKRSLWG
jgi:hypothetical protein